MATMLTSREEFPPLHISVSAARTLQRCPREYAYRAILGLPPERTSSRLVLGGAMHRALACFYTAMRDSAPLPSLDAMLDVVVGAFEEAKLEGASFELEEGESERGLLEEAHGLLAAFSKQPYLPAQVLAVEQPFVLDLVDTRTGELVAEERIVGIFDLVAIGEDRALTVVDHKISKRHMADPADLQLPAYARVAREIYGANEIELRWQVLQRGRTPKVQLVRCERRPHDEDEAVEGLAAAVTMVRAAVREPEPLRLLGRRRGWSCGTCAYATRCASDRI